MSRAPTGLAVLIFVASACGSTSTSGAGTPSPSPSSGGATTSTAPTAASPSAPSGASAKPSVAVPAGFSCTYPYSRAASTTGVVQVTNVRIGRHPDYDRVVFDLAGSAFPAVTLETVTPPLTADPSDLPVAVAGNSFVRIVLGHASGAGYSTGGAPTYTGPRAFAPRYPRLTSLVERGDFEAVFSWYAGLTGPVCYRVFVMKDPNLLAIDFATR